MVVPMALASDPASDVHGPCDRCGVRFTSHATAPRPRCPNCGHRGACGDAPESDEGEIRVPVEPGPTRRPPLPHGWPVN
jgi:tRNA(Ile2) C34 agmatinyltransferase TiaS